MGLWVFVAVMVGCWVWWVCGGFHLFKSRVVVGLVVAVGGCDWVGLVVVKPPRGGCAFVIWFLVLARGFDL